MRYSCTPQTFVLLVGNHTSCFLLAFSFQPGSKNKVGSVSRAPYFPASRDRAYKLKLSIDKKNTGAARTNGLCLTPLESSRLWSRNRALVLIAVGLKLSQGGHQCGLHATLGSLRRGKESSRVVPSLDLTGLLFGAYFYLAQAHASVLKSFSAQRMTSSFSANKGNFCYFRKTSSLLV